MISLKEMFFFILLNTIFVCNCQLIEQYTSNQGFAVSLYENRVAIGAPGDNNNLGSVLTYVNNGTHWNIEQKILSDFTMGDFPNQGYSVSLYNNTLAVGGIGDDNAKGATWIYEYNDGYWIEMQKLVASDSIGSSNQGSSVSLFGNLLAVGGPFDDTGVGATWIFERVEGFWVQKQKLIATETNGYASQGTSVSLYNNTVAIGGIDDNEGTGATWIFKKINNIWVEQTKLVGSEYIYGSQQGASVSLYQDTVAIGGNIDNFNVGATWIFTFDGYKWNENQKLVGSGNIGTSNQGSSVTLSGNYLAIGGYNDNNSIGAVWLFQNVSGTWIQIRKIIQSTSLFQGRSVSIFETSLAIGSPFDTGATWIVDNIEITSSPTSAPTFSGMCECLG